MTRLRLASFVVAIAGSVQFARPADAPNFPGNEDLRHFRSLNSPRLSPDGHQVLIRVIESTADGAKSHLWLIDIDKNSFRQLTYSPDSDKKGESAGEWMPDGNSILFLAHRGEQTQLFRLPTNGGEAKPFDLKVLPPADASKLPGSLPPAKESTKTESGKKEETAEPLPIDIASFVVSPDGKTIAFFANDPKTPGEKKQTDAKADAVWVDHEAHGTRLYLLDPETSKITPVAIPANARSADFAPDSSRLFAISEEPNGASDLKPSSVAWLVTLSDPSHPVKMSYFPATLQSAVWSMNGGKIGFLAQAKLDTPPGYRDLFEYNVATHGILNLTSSYIGSVGFQPQIPLPDESILLPVNTGVDGTVLRIDTARTKLTAMKFPVPVVGSLDTNMKRTGWVFLGSGPTQPTSLYYVPELGQPPKLLNIPTLMPANNRSVESKRVSWKSDGLTIEGLLYLPPQAAEHKVPLIVQVHGGPLGAYLDTYQSFVNFLVGQGWAVLRTNPRGSTNYGASFAAANKNDLGGGDYRDIMAGLDAVIKTEPIDTNKLVLEGYSYGGEMAGFVEGKTARFNAIISGAPVIDQYSEYGTEGDSIYDRWYFGKPWEHPQDAWRQSPLAGVGHATTPFMLLQGEADTTDPLGQSQEMYRALRQMGVPVELITYPRESHGGLGGGIYGAPNPEPWHGFDARQRMVQFIKKAFGEP